jgi:hypothetical protein
MSITMYGEPACSAMASGPTSSASCSASSHRVSTRSRPRLQCAADVRLRLLQGAPQTVQPTSAMAAVLGEAAGHSDVVESGAERGVKLGLPTRAREGHPAVNDWDAGLAQ